MKRPLLSPRETVYLRWMLRGMSVAEVAAIKGKSTIDIELCLKHARIVLKAHSIGEVTELLAYGHCPERLN